MTRNTGRAQCVHIADPCNKVAAGATVRFYGTIANTPVYRPRFLGHRIEAYAA
jgi:hypothetical protein